MGKNRVQSSRWAIELVHQIYEVGVAMLQIGLFSILKFIWKIKEASRFCTLKDGEKHTHAKDGKSTRFLRKAAFGRFWRLLAAFWESWKAIREEEVVRRRTQHNTYISRLREREDKAHISRMWESEEKARKSRQRKGEDKIKIFWEWEWEWEWDSLGVDGWIELLHGVILLQNYCKDSSDWFILESPFLFICDY